MPTRKLELIRRAPHTGLIFEVDNQKVFAMPKAVFFNGPMWNWIKQHSRAQNGRAAMLIIRQHHMGTAFQNRIKSAADSTLESTFYDGKARNFTFENFTSRIQGAFTDLEENGESVSENRKVRTLLKCIQDPKLEAAKSQVIATASYRNDFDQAVNFVSAFAVDKETMLARARKIGSASRESDGGRGERFC